MIIKHGTRGTILTASHLEEKSTPEPKNQSHSFDPDIIVVNKPILASVHTLIPKENKYFIQMTFPFQNKPYSLIADKDNLTASEVDELIQHPERHSLFYIDPASNQKENPYPLVLFGNTSPEFFDENIPVSQHLLHLINAKQELKIEFLGDLPFQYHNHIFSSNQKETTIPLNQIFPLYSSSDAFVQIPVVHIIQLTEQNDQPSTNPQTIKNPNLDYSNEEIVIENDQLLLIGSVIAIGTGIFILKLLRKRKKPPKSPLEYDIYEDEDDEIAKGLPSFFAHQFGQMLDRSEWRSENQGVDLKLQIYICRDDIQPGSFKGNRRRLKEAINKSRPDTDCKAFVSAATGVPVKAIPQVLTRPSGSFLLVDGETERWLQEIKPEKARPGDLIIVTLLDKIGKPNHVCIFNGPSDDDRIKSINQTGFPIKYRRPEVFAFYRPRPLLQRVNPFRKKEINL